MKLTYQQLIPNCLTGFRIIITPILILLGFINQIPAVIILTIMAAFTDLIDGKLARHFGTVSSMGAKLDAIADKIFAIGLTTCLATQFSKIWIIAILEILLGILNLVFYYRSKKTESLMIGKIKTTILFSTIVVIMMTHFFPNLSTIMYGSIMMTLNLQCLCILAYSVNFYDNMHPITIENNEMHQKIMNEETKDTLEQTITIDNLDEFAKRLKEIK